MNQKTFGFKYFAMELMPFGSITLLQNLPYLEYGINIQVVVVSLKLIQMDLMVRIGLLFKNGSLIFFGAETSDQFKLNRSMSL